MKFIYYYILICILLASSNISFSRTSIAQSRSLNHSSSDASKIPTEVHSPTNCVDPLNLSIIKTEESACFKKYYVAYSPYGIDYKHFNIMLELFLKNILEYSENSPSLHRLCYNKQINSTFQHLLLDNNIHVKLNLKRPISSCIKAIKYNPVFQSILPGTDIKFEYSTSLKKLDSPKNSFTYRYELGIHGKYSSHGFDILATKPNSIADKLNLKSGDKILLCGPLHIIDQEIYNQINPHLNLLSSNITPTSGEQNCEMDCSLYSSNKNFSFQNVSVQKEKELLIISNFSLIAPDSDMITSNNKDSINNNYFGLVTQRPLSDASFSWDGEERWILLVEKKNKELYCYIPFLLEDENWRRAGFISNEIPIKKNKRSRVQSKSLRDNIGYIKINDIPRPMFIDKENCSFFPEFLKALSDVKSSSGLILDLRDLGIHCKMDYHHLLQSIYIIKQLLPRNVSLKTDFGLIFGEDCKLFSQQLESDHKTLADFANSMYDFIKNPKKKKGGRKYLNEIHKTMGYRSTLKAMLDQIPKHFDENFPHITILVNERTKGAGELISRILDDFVLCTAGKSTYGECTLYEDTPIFDSNMKMNGVPITHVEWFEDTVYQHNEMKTNSFKKSADCNIIFTKIAAQLLIWTVEKNQPLFLENRPFIPCYHLDTEPLPDQIFGDSWIRLLHTRLSRKISK